jgi:hypothetical protein
MHLKSSVIFCAVFGRKAQAGKRSSMSSRADVKATPDPHQYLPSFKPPERLANRSPATKAQKCLGVDQGTLRKRMASSKICFAIDCMGILCQKYSIFSDMARATVLAGPPFPRIPAGCGSQSDAKGNEKEQLRRDFPTRASYRRSHEFLLSDQCKVF